MISKKTETKTGYCYTVLVAKVIKYPEKKAILSY